MLTLAKFQNFRCLRSVDVGLRPLTVLIGPNDSGKSSFIEALNFLSNRTGFGLHDHWKGRDDKQIAISVFDDRTQTYIRAEGFHRKGVHHYQIHSFPSLAFFQLPTTGVNMQSKGVPDTDQVPELGPNGNGVPTVLDYLLRRNRKSFDEFVREVCDRIPGVEDVHVSSPLAEERGIDLVIEKGYRIPGERLSNGIRLILFFLTLRYHPAPPGIVLIEEPENGVHRARLAEIVKLLRDMTQESAPGRRVQVILTTHSPHLLDHIDPEKDQVLVFQRSDDGSRTVNEVDQSRLGPFLDEFMLGEVWFNTQEEGLVKPKG